MCLALRVCVRVWACTCAERARLDERVRVNKKNVRDRSSKVSKLDCALNVPDVNQYRIYISFS